MAQAFLPGFRDLTSLGFRRSSGCVVELLPLHNGRVTPCHSLLPRFRPNFATFHDGRLRAPRLFQFLSDGSRVCPPEVSVSLPELAQLLHSSSAQMLCPSGGASRPDTVSPIHWSPCLRASRTTSSIFTNPPRRPSSLAHDMGVTAQAHLPQDANASRPDSASPARH